jgi:hypothetical protein
MKELLFWLYLVNTLLLILHEIDSAHWKEWKLFHLPGGEAGFLLLHIPLLLPVLYGLVLLDRSLFAGIILSLLLSLAGLLTFLIHAVFIRRGHSEFKTTVSLGILCAILLISLAQLGVTAVMLA